MINLTPFTIAWAMLGVVVAALALMRRSVSGQEDDTLHLGGAGAALTTQQTMIAKKLEMIDKWGKILTIALAVTGLILAILYGMQVWDESSRVGLK
jgi:hypothetical protein